MFSWPGQSIAHLDEAYRFAPGLDGRPLGARGRWVNEHTFAVEVNGITTNEQFGLWFDFAGDGVVVQFQEQNGGRAKIVGNAQTP